MLTSQTTTITRRHALGLAASAALGTALAGASPARAAGTAQDLFVVTANFGRTNNRAAYGNSMAKLRNGVRLKGQADPVRCLVGFQEIGEGDNDPNLERALINQYFNVHFDKYFLDPAQTPSYRDPIVVPPPFTKVSQNFVRTHGGVSPHRSPPRFINEVVVQAANQPMLRLAILNTHYIANAYNGQERADLKHYWDTHNEIHRNRIAFYHQQGIPVIWTGDVNRRQMGPLHPMEQRAFQNGLDQIRWVPGSDGTQIALHGTTSVPLSIDGHNAQVARLRLTRP